LPDDSKSVRDRFAGWFDQQASQVIMTQGFVVLVTAY